MVREKYGVRLEPEQRDRLEHLVRAGKSPARVATRAQILPKPDDGWSAPQVAQARVWSRARCTGSSGVLPRLGWRGCCGTGPRPTGTGSWMTGGKPTSSRWPAAQRPQGMTTGPCACWPGRWWSWGWRPPCPTRVYATGSKKHSQAVAEAGMVHSQGERRLRSPYGGHLGPVCRTL